MTAPPEEDKLRRLLDVGRTLVSELDTEAVLERILAEARAITGARYVAVGVLDERVYLAGGRLEVQSGETGTFVRARLPVPSHP